MTDPAPLTLAAARAMLDRAVAHAESLGVKVSLAVVDAGGVPVATARMDGTSFISPEIALGKAFTAAAFRAPSGKVAENMAPAPAFASAVSAVIARTLHPAAGRDPATRWRSDRRQRREQRRGRGDRARWRGGVTVASPGMILSEVPHALRP